MDLDEDLSDPSTWDPELDAVKAAAPDGTRYAYERSAVATANIASCDPRSLMLRTLCAHVTAPLGAKESTYTTHSRTCRSRYSESTAP